MSRGFSQNSNTIRGAVILIASAIGLLLTGCGDKSEAGGSSPNDSESAATGNVPVLLFSKLENLRIRESPGLKGEVVAAINEGDSLIFLNEKSDFSDEIELRGVNYQEPWLKVEVPGGTQGWVFGGAVSFGGEQAVAGHTVGNQEDPLKDWLLVPGESVGPIKRFTSEAELKEIFGAENVETELDEGLWGSVWLTQLFNHQRNEILIRWVDENLEEIHSISTRAEGSDWHTVSGVEIGMKKGELEKLNGKPFTFSSWGWDYGGIVQDWNGGKLEERMKGRDGKISVSMGYRGQLNPEQWDRVTGNFPIPSDSSILEDLEVYVAILWLSFE